MSEDKTGEQLKKAISDAVESGRKPKEVLKALRKKYPKARSKDFALASFALMLEVADRDGDAAAIFHEIGLSERGQKDS